MLTRMFYKQESDPARPSCEVASHAQAFVKEPST